MLIHWIKEKY